MNILYLGDIMGQVGLELIEEVLPGLRTDLKADLVIAQAENVTDGKGVSLVDFQRLQKAGVDFCTGGNWTLHNSDIFGALGDPKQLIIRPANYPDGTAGLGYKYVEVGGKNKVLVVSILGHIVGKDSDKPVNNPLKTIDQILKSQSDVNKDAVIVNFHGDYSSEKVVIGHYLDGRVTAVIGDHWHVPTADARVLPAGTAHITDVGMCGALDASLGVKVSSIIPRWRDGKQTRNILEHEGLKQLNAVLIKTDLKGLASSIEQIQRLF